MQRDVSIEKRIGRFPPFGKQTNKSFATLRARNSPNLWRYAFNEIVASRRTWGARLPAWVYGERPVGATPNAFPAPPPRRFDIGTPTLPRRQIRRMAGTPTASATESEVERAKMTTPPTMRIRREWRCQAQRAKVRMDVCYFGAGYLTLLFYVDSI